MYIELVDKIIKFPPTENYLVQGENNSKEIIIKIPRTLLTSKIGESTVYIISKLNTNESAETKLDFIYEEEDFAYYKWNFTEIETKEEGELSIQFKIEKVIPETKENLLGEEIDPGFSYPMTYDYNGIWYSFTNKFKITKQL